LVCRPWEVANPALTPPTFSFTALVLFERLPTSGPAGSAASAVSCVGSASRGVQPHVRESIGSFLRNPCGFGAELCRHLPCPLVKKRNTGYTPGEIPRAGYRCPVKAPLAAPGAGAEAGKILGFQILTLPQPSGNFAPVVNSAHSPVSLGSWHRLRRFPRQRL